MKFRLKESIDEYLNEDWASGLRVVVNCTTDSVRDAIEKGNMVISAATDEGFESIVGKTSLKVTINGSRLFDFVNVYKDKCEFWFTAYDKDIKDWVDSGITTLNRIIKTHNIEESVRSLVNELVDLIQEADCDIIDTDIKISTSKGSYEFKQSNIDESLKEDWRDGQFTEDDFNKYVDKTMDNINHILTSISFMKRKHPEYAELFDNLVSEIVDKFEGVILLKEDLDKSKNNSEEDILDEVNKLLPSEVKIEHNGPTTNRGLTFDLFKIEGPTGNVTGTCVYLADGRYDVSLTNSSEGKFSDAESIARFFADHYNISI